MRLKDTVLQEIKKNPDLRRDLMRAHKKTEYTILKWIRENNPQLVSSLDIIAGYLRLDIEEMIIREECDFKPVI